MAAKTVNKYHCIQDLRSIRCFWGTTYFEKGWFGVLDLAN